MTKVHLHVGGKEIATRDADSTDLRDWVKKKSDLNDALERVRENDRTEAVARLERMLAEHLKKRPTQDARPDMREMGQRGLYYLENYVPKVGDWIDYYDRSGNKQYGKVTYYDGRKLMVGGLTLLVQRSAHDYGPMSKAEVRYVDVARDPAESCSRCQHFLGGDDCEVVSEPIRAAGWCEEFLRAAQTADGVIVHVHRGTRDAESRWFSVSQREYERLYDGAQFEQKGVSGRVVEKNHKGALSYMVKVELARGTKDAGEDREWRIFVASKADGGYVQVKEFHGPESNKAENERAAKAFYEAERAAGKKVSMAMGYFAMRANATTTLHK